MKTHSKLLKRLVLLSFGMFLFAFALVPLYDVFCEVTGLNGKPSLEKATLNQKVVSKRQVDIGFITSAPANSPFEVLATKKRLTVTLGEMNKVSFDAKNLTSEHRVMQSIPSVSPGLAAQHLHKIECFCFQQQNLDAGQEEQLTLHFYIDDKLPNDIEELTLSYSIFDISDKL